MAKLQEVPDAPGRKVGAKQKPVKAQKLLR